MSATLVAPVRRTGKRKRVPRRTDAARVAPDTDGRITLQEHVTAGQEAERAGQPQAARAHFERALQAVRDPADAHLTPSLFRWIAWTHAKTGDPHAALECLDAAEAAATALGDPRALASVLNTRAGTLFNLGELDEAEEIFRRVRDLAWRIQDRKLQAMADQNLGSVASIRGDLRQALTRFQSSLKGYEGLGQMEYVGPLLNNIGRLQTDLGEDAEAEETFDRARTLCSAEGDRHHQIIVEVNRARLFLRSGRPMPALRACDEARGLAETTGDDRWMAEIHLVSGSSHARLGHSDVAIGFLERAAGLARGRQDAKVLADVALAQAVVYREVGKSRETLQSLNEAHRIFQRLRARRELADVDTRLAELQAAYLQIVQEWGESIESKDAYTQGHCSRVAEYACMLATASGLPEEDLTWFRMGALLHDVGKVSVPLDVLNKRGPLDEDERALMSEHPAEGVKLLDGVDFPWDVRPMIRHHHERYDGRGYPDGIAGCEIPFSARILTVADIYDALTTSRSYRPGYAHEHAMDIMEAEKGRTVDPALFELFAEEVAPLIPRQPMPLAASA